jgi:hypothetical protein
LGAGDQPDRGDGTGRTDISAQRIEWWLSFVYRALLQRPAEDLDDRASMDALVRDFSRRR